MFARNKHKLTHQNQVVKHQNHYYYHRFNNCVNDCIFQSLLLSSWWSFVIRLSSIAH